MNLHWILFPLLAASLSGEVITGVIETFGQDQFQLKTGTGSVSIATDTHTKIRKAAAALTVGDQIRVTYYGEPSSKMVAVNISASVTLRGMVTESNATRLTLRIHKADGDSSVFVFLHPETKLGASRRELVPGREIQVKGWDVADGIVDAAQIAICNADIPLRLPRKS